MEKLLKVCSKHIHDLNPKRNLKFYSLFSEMLHFSTLRFGHFCNRKGSYLGKGTNRLNDAWGKRDAGEFWKIQVCDFISCFVCRCTNLSFRNATTEEASKQQQPAREIPIVSIPQITVSQEHEPPASIYLAFFLFISFLYTIQLMTLGSNGIKTIFVGNLTFSVTSEILGTFVGNLAR